MNKDMQIQTADDVQLLLEFFNDGLKECSWLPNNFGEVLEFCQSQNVLLTNKILVIFTNNSNFTYIDTIYVIKKYRGYGLATTVLQYFTEQTRTCIICNKNLIEFYEKLGFRQDKDLPYAIMIKEKSK